MNIIILYEYMKVALAFWGLTRSLKYTIDSINNKIINKFKEHGIQYKIFMHTWIVNSVYNNSRSKEHGVVLDNTEYSLLNPDYIELQDQDDFKQKINFNAFRTHKDPWNTNYETVNNFICAMFSKSRCTQLIDKSNENFDYIIYLRPDVLYLNDFDVNFFKKVNSNTICIPNFALHNNFNDRFCIVNMKTYKLYGHIFKKLFEYSKHCSLHSETVHYKLMIKNKIKIEKINFIFKRVRADGRICAD
jgi:hypothetical protein